MSIKCLYKECKKLNTSACNGCGRSVNASKDKDIKNHKEYEDLYDDGRNMICGSSICVYRDKRQKCTLEMGEGSVPNCDRESELF